MLYGVLAAIVTIVITVLMTDRTTVVSPNQKNVAFEFSPFLRRFFRFAIVFLGICLCVAVYFGIQEKYESLLVMIFVLGAMLAGCIYCYLTFNNKSAMLMKGNLYTSDWRGRESVHAINDIVAVTVDPNKGTVLTFEDGFKYTLDRMMSNNSVLLKHLAENGITVKDRNGKPYKG